MNTPTQHTDSCFPQLVKTNNDSKWSQLVKMDPDPGNQQHRQQWERSTTHQRRRCNGGWRGGGGGRVISTRRKRMNNNSNFHSTKTTTGSTYEEVTLGLCKENEIFATAPVPSCILYRTIVVPCLVHLKHIVLVFRVPEWDEIADDKGVVVGPQSVVDSGVPSSISANNVVCGGANSEEEKEEQGANCCWWWAGHVVNHYWLIPFLEYIILASGPILHFLETLLERKEKKRSKHANKSPSFKFFTFNALLHSSFSSSVYSSTSLQSLICYLKP